VKNIVKLQDKQTFHQLKNIIFAQKIQKSSKVRLGQTYFKKYF